MQRDGFPCRQFILSWAILAGILTCFGPETDSAEAGVNKREPTSRPTVAQGSLIGVDADGRPQSFCPLTHTDVKVEISGFLARVNVTQQFENASTGTIEAVYTFPLPQNSAVDAMTLLVGDRTVRAKITRREEAQAIYDAARSGGKIAGLLDQERPNIFTQSVANILPGERVTISISYVELLRYEDGAYELIFPMVVGPRYVPGAPIGQQGGGWAPDTHRVPDGSRITPPVTPPGTRSGHDLSIEVAMDAGIPIEAVTSPTHDIEVQRQSAHRATVRLRQAAVIPNKDFILRYDVAGRKMEHAVLAHRNGHDGFFTLILQPPDRIAPVEATPKELVFVLDTSGSMSGFPIEKAKETMKLALEGLYPRDTFNVMTFSGDTHILFHRPVPATPQHLKQAYAFLESRHGGGGTEMMKAIRAALDPSDAQTHVRIVCFMTDGYVGNDMEIMAEIQKHPNARVFAFGVGSSVNRFLLDKMAAYGRGEVEYVSLQDDGSAAAKRFHERVRNPLLTDVLVEWGGLPVTDVYPKRIPDLFSAKPVVLHGRYARGGTGMIRLRGKAANGDVMREIRVDLPSSETRHDVLATLWARTRIEDLMGQDYAGIQRGAPRPEIRTAITQLGLDHGLMTQFTSFIAVEEMVITDGGEPRRIDVQVEMPEGVSYEGVFGRTDGEYKSGRGGGGARSASTPSFAMGKQALSEAAVPSDHYDTPRRSEPAGKLHPSLAAVVKRLKDKRIAPSEAESKFVRNGVAEIQIWLLDTSEETMTHLKSLGVELILRPKTGKVVIGRVPITKLTALSDLNAVRYVAPQISSL